MAEASYERQHLALQAAGWINDVGTTQITFGCTMTRIAEGEYALLLDENSGVVDYEGFTLVTPKTSISSGGVMISVTNTTPRQKNILLIDTPNDSPVNRDIEVALFKSVAR